MRSSFSFLVRPPSACSAHDISEFKRLILAGGEVSVETLPALVARAFSLALAKAGNHLAAVGAIKRPNPGYRNGLFEKAGVKGSGAELELGWIYVDPPFRGNRLASDLVEKLVHSLDGVPVYATSRVDNHRMRASLLRFGFKAVGVPYASQLNEPDIQLFVRV